MHIPNNIKQAISNDSLVIFAGSGLSKRFNLPTWNEFVKDSIKEIDNPIYTPFISILDSGVMNAFQVLQSLQQEHNTIKKYIRRRFKIESGDFSLHKKIMSLAGKVITTNYDNAFEIANDNKIDTIVYDSKFNVSEINKSTNPYVFKLHGCISNPDTCLVFQNEYDNLYKTETAAINKLKTIFAEKTILFIGFSFNDLEINSLFENLDRVFGNNSKHFILSTEPNNTNKYDFLQHINIDSFNDIDNFIDECCILKHSLTIASKTVIVPTNSIRNRKKIGILTPNPLDISIGEDIEKVFNCFESLDCDIHKGALNSSTLSSVDDIDLLVIITKTFKDNVYIEGDFLKSELASIDELISFVPNENIPILLIVNEKVHYHGPNNVRIINCFKSQVINKFIYKSIRLNETNFTESEIALLNTTWPDLGIQKGTSSITSFYGNNRDLNIGKKSLTGIIGRVEEQISIAARLLSIIKSNKLLNIKASGGVGKTTLIKKVAYELYNRGFYREGVTFKSCENVISYSDFEEVLLEGFNLRNILNFKEYLIDNHSLAKINLLVILDNFETVVNNLSKQDLAKVFEILKFATDYANIVITSREKLSSEDDFEEVYTLLPLITDDALELFELHYGKIKDENELRVLRNEILEDILNNNPLAIKLVTKSKTRLNSIYDLKNELEEHFFESTNDDYSIVFNSSSDRNIERTKSIFNSINYSYVTLNTRQKLAFDILHLFPDGITLPNFKKCFQKTNSAVNISEKELRVLRDKSLIEDYNGILQLQPIIRRFAEYKFSKRPNEIKSKYCLDAYIFNVYVLEWIEFLHHKKNRSVALGAYSRFKNNLLLVLDYFEHIEINEKGSVREKEYLLNYISSIQEFVVSDKQVKEFKDKLVKVKSYFLDVPKADLLLEVAECVLTYYNEEFDLSYQRLSEIMPVEELGNRGFDTENLIERRYRDMVANVHSMEGHTLARINSLINNNMDCDWFVKSHLFYLGIPDKVSVNKLGFYSFEYSSMFNELDCNSVEAYLESLHEDQHLERMQCTYTLSKNKVIEEKSITKLVVTNPYTKGLKSLMQAFITSDISEKHGYFKSALKNLHHIKYYYLEALYYYVKFLIEISDSNYIEYLNEGLNSSDNFRYQYINFLFENIDKPMKLTYDFNYSYYNVANLEEFVIKHNNYWEKFFRENEIVEMNL